MQRLEVRNIGPLKEIDLEIKDYMLFIGENASGKSTLLKLIYFFNKLPEYIADYYNQSFLGKNSYLLQSFYKLLSLDIRFGVTEASSIKYRYNDLIQVVLILPGGHTLPFTPTFSKGFEQFTKECETIKEFHEGKVVGGTSNQSKFLQVKTDYLIEIRECINRYFNNSLKQNKLVFPDSKHFLSLNPYSGPNILYRDFKEQIESTEFYLKSQLESEGVDNKFTTKILKGKPVKVSDRWYGIEMSNGLKINYFELSSSQKELYWMTLSLYGMLGENSKNSVFIEEPETHLHPNTLKALTEFIGYLFNQNNKFCITTHSYHVLGVVNNLVNAYRIGQQNKTEVREIITEEYWLDASKIFVGELKNGKLIDIYDKENSLYDLDYLSKVPEEINTDYGKLLDLEFEEVDD